MSGAAYLRSEFQPTLQAAKIDWEFFEREWAGFFPSATGRPATSPRLVAGLLYLQHAFRPSDEAVVARWVEDPYFQHFTGETFFQHKPPIDPTSLIRWRKRIGEEGVEWLLTKTIEAGRKSGAVEDASLDEVAVETTVMEFKGTVAPVAPRKPRDDRASDGLPALRARTGATGGSGPGRRHRVAPELRAPRAAAGGAGRRSHPAARIEARGTARCEADPNARRAQPAL